MPAEEHLLAVQLMNVQGPLARRVADVRLGLQILMGAHPSDPWSINAPFLWQPVSKPIRVAPVPAPPGGSCSPVVPGVVRRAVDALANAGYEMVETCPPRYEEAVATWAQFLVGDFSLVFDKLLPMMGTAARPSSPSS